MSYLREKKHDLIVFPELDFKVHIDDWVAIAGACDGIISVSTALVHFAGAIGQKVAVGNARRTGTMASRFAKIPNQWLIKT